MTYHQIHGTSEPQVDVEAVDAMVRDRIGNAYEVFERDGSYYINAPLYEDESCSIDSPTCAYIMDSCDCAGNDELYINALHASEECDRLISIREERS